ncbi:MAG: hypothetical protein ACODAJ_07350 [Planctomycetota bacterium]
MGEPGRPRGRLGAKADRKAKTLIVRKLLFEPDFQDYDGVNDPLSARLEAFAAFNGCDRVVIEQTEPRDVKRPLSRALNSMQ